MSGKIQLEKVEFKCTRCNPFFCTITLHLNKFAEDKAPTTQIRKICPVFASRDNYATFEKIGFVMKERKEIAPIIEVA